MVFAFALVLITLYLAGPALGFALASLMASVAVAEAVLTRRWPRVNSKDWAWIAYAALASIPTIRSGSWREAGFFLQIVVFPWVLTFAMQNVHWTRRRVQMVFASLALAALLAGAIMLFQVSPGVFDVSFHRLVTLNRQDGFYFLKPNPGGPNAVAAMGAAGVALVLAYLKYFREGVAVAQALLGAFLVFLLVAGGRNAWVSVVGLVVLFAITGGRVGVSSRVSVGTVATLAVAAVVLTFMASALVSQHERQLYTRVTGLLNPQDDSTFQVRVYVYWALAVEMIVARPSGWGFNAFFARYNVTPHNELLGQLVGGGVLGAIGFVGVMAAVAIPAARRLLSPVREHWQQSAHYCAFSLLVIAALAMITEHIARSATFYPIVWMVAGMSYGVAAQASEQTPAPGALQSRPRPMSCAETAA